MATPLGQQPLSPDMEAQKAAPAQPIKPRRPPSPHVPRAFAVVAILVLLAIPIAVPIVIMKMTGTSGKKYVDLSAAITGPEVTGLQPTAAEEVSPEEVKESFLKVNDKNVSATARVGPGVTCWCKAHHCAARAPNDQVLQRLARRVR